MPARVRSWVLPPASDLVARALSYHYIRPLALLLLLILGLAGVTQAQGPLPAARPAPAVRPAPNGASIQSWAWHTETIDPSPYVGQYGSLELYLGQYDVVAYYDLNNGNLKFATRGVGRSWTISTVDTEGDVGAAASLGQNGLASHISYLDASSGALKYAAWNGSAWYTTTVDSNVRMSTAIAVESNNKAHLVYDGCLDNCLKYATYVDTGGNCGGGAWQCDVIGPEPQVVLDVSIALDGIGRPHVAYYDAANQDLKYAYRDGTTWYDYVIDSAGDVGQYTSIAMGYGNVPSISYYDVTNGDLKFATYVGTGGNCGMFSDWNCSTLDSAGDVGQFTSLDMHTAFGVLQPAISYYDKTNGNLKYALNGYMGLWFVYTVDSAGDVGKFTSLEMDAQNSPHITYYDATNGHLKYARMEYRGYLPVVDKNWRSTTGR